MGVTTENKGFLFIAVVLCACAVASQVLAGKIGELLNINIMDRNKAGGKVNEGVDIVSWCLSFTACILLILAFLTAPGKGRSYHRY